MWKRKKSKKKELNISGTKGTWNSRRTGVTQRPVEIVLQARARLSGNNEDAIVSKDHQKFARGEDLHNNEVFSGTFSGSDGVSELMEGGETGVLEEAGCRTNKRDRKLQSDGADIGDDKMVHSCAWRRKKTLKNLHIGGLEGISCKRLQVMVTNLLQKHWEWQEERNSVRRHGTV